MVRSYALFLIFAAACVDSSGNPQDASTSGGGANTGAVDAFFAPNDVHEVELTLADADWAQLRGEGRALAQIFSACDKSEFAYTVFPADATVDGKHVGQIGVRKKGYLGSLSILRPSLHLSIDAFTPKLNVQGATTITLNNNRQDPSYTHTCMAYAVFKKAGVPAPRCSYAHVVVNGEDLGLYANTEPIKKELVARYYPDNSGNLWEGAGGADFRDDMLDGFTQKTNTKTPTTAALVAVTEALKKTGSARNAALEKVVDMDEFMKFWAIESLISHWDGYTGDLNNFFVYEQPDTHKLVFIPWGPDAAFVKDHPFLTEVGRPLSVLAWARMPDLLYADPTMQARYRKVLGQLLHDAWDEKALLAEVDRIAKIAGDHASPKMLDAQRTFIMERRAEVQKELDEKTAPAWTIKERMPTMCVPGESTPASGTFKAKWGDPTAFAADPTIAITVQAQGKPQKLAGLMAAAGNYTDPSTGVDAPVVRILGFRADGQLVLVQFSLGNRTLAPKQTIPLHGLESIGFVAVGSSPTTLNPVTIISDGTISFDKAGMNDGDVVSGKFSGVALRLDLPGGNPVFAQ